MTKEKVGLMEVNKILQGDSLEVLKTLPDESINCCITSPPYFNLRDYGIEGQLGLEKTPEEYVAKLVEIFREVKRVLKKEGNLWLNLGDSYNGNKTGNTETAKNPNVATNSFKKEKSPLLKEKDLVGIPWRVAFALQADGWYLRQDIIWHKPNPMPESVQDRFCKSHEYIFLLSKSPRYYFDLEAVKEPTVDNTKSHEYNEGYGQETLRPEIQSFGEGAGDSKEILLFQEGTGSKESVSEEIHNDGRTEIAVSSRGSQARKRGEIQGTEEALRPKQKGENGESEARQAVGENREGKICETKDRNQKEVSNSDNGLPTNKKRVGNNQKETQSSVCVLPQKTNEVGDRPCDAIIAERETHSREHSSGLSELQRSERKPHKSAVTPGQTPHTKALKRMAGEKDPEYNTRNKRSVWTVTTKPFKDAHFATFPEDLIVPMVKAGCPKEVCKKCGVARERVFESKTEYTPVEPITEKGQARKEGKGIYRANSKETGGMPISEKKEVGLTDCSCGEGFGPGLVLDPFMGSGTTALVAKKLGRNYIGIELNPEYIKIAEKRLAQDILL